MNRNEFKVFFWGVRGSCPTIDQNMMEFGGNTSCIHIEVNGRLLIFDGGTGIQKLGKYLQDKNEEVNGDIFITHTHWDHIQGLPFFTPFFNKNNKFNIYGQRKSDIPFSSIIKDIMRFPYSPIKWDDMGSLYKFIEINNDEEIDIKDEIVVKTIQTDHPDGCLGYRIEYENKSCCYITDLEHSDDFDVSLREFVKNCDLLIYDSNYTNEEYIGNEKEGSKKGWGHSTWEKGVELSKKSDVKKLILFHHNNNRNDNEIKAIENKAKMLFKNTFAAYEGMEISI